MEIERAIEQIESGIRRLKVQYDIFFAGGAKRPPVEQRAELDRLIREVSNVSNGRYAERFQLTSVLGKYNAFVELWNRQMRNTEEGVDFLESRGSRRRQSKSLAPRSPHQDPAPKSTAPAPAGKATSPAMNGVIHTIRVSNPASESTVVRELYQRYMTLRTEREGAAPRLAFESFCRQISRQAQNLKSTSACDAVEFDLTVMDTRIGIKARPIPVSGTVTRDESKPAQIDTAEEVTR